MAVAPAKSKQAPAKTEPNLLDRIGNEWNKLTGGNKAKAKPGRGGPPRGTGGRGNSPAPTNTAPTARSGRPPPVAPLLPPARAGTTAAPTGKKNFCDPSEAPPEVIHRFEGKSREATDGFFGLGKRRDTSHQVVQKRDAKGVWQVSVQSVNSGRVNPNQHAFSSTRRVTVEDFNDPNSALSKGARVATERLNADSNRLPDVPAPVQKKPPQPKLSGVDWAKQQAANTVAGATSSVTSLVGMVTSLPEMTGKLGASVVRVPATLAAEATGGAVFANTRNPIRNDQWRQWNDAPTDASQFFARGQNELNKALGANADSLTYKVSEFAAPMLLGAKGGKGVKTSRPGSTSTTVVVPQTAASVRAVKGPNGTVQLTKPNGAAATMPEVAEAVAAGKLKISDLRQAGMSPAKIRGIQKRAENLKNYWTGGSPPPPSTTAQPRPQPQPASPSASAQPATGPQRTASSLARTSTPVTSTAPITAATTPPVTAATAAPAATRTTADSEAAAAALRASTPSIVKNANGNYQLKLPDGSRPSPSQIIEGLSKGTVYESDLLRAGISPAAVQSAVQEANVLRGATTPRPPASTTPLDEVLRQVGQHLKSPEFQQRLATSNSPAEIARSNAAIQRMRAEGQTTASYTRPDPGADYGLQPQPAVEPTAARQPDFAEPLTRRPLDLAPGQPPATVARATNTPPEPTGTTSTNNPAQTRTPNLPTISETPTSGVPPGGTPPTGRRGGGRGNDGRPEAPLLLTPLQKAIGSLSQAMEMNLNPQMQAITKGIADHSIPIDRFPTAMPQNASESRISTALIQSGVDANRAPQAAKDVITIAQGMDVNPTQLANQVIRSTREAKELVARYTPQNPLLVDGSKPATIAEGTRYLTALFSQGVNFPARTEAISANGQTWDVLFNPGLQTTAMNSDIDGPFAASYGQKGLDVTAKDRFGKPVHFFLETPKLSGKPFDITLSAGGDPLVAEVSVEVTTSQQTGVQKVAIPITVEQRQLIESMNRYRGEAKLQMQYVEGLSARLFPPDSVNFWRAVSQQNGRGGTFPGGVTSPAIVFNTFGSLGQRAFANPAELVTSLARSLQPGAVPRNFPDGLFAAPNLKVYSGGSSVTSNGVSSPFGLSPTQEQSMREVADALPELVTRYARKYGLSQDVTNAWHNSIFANPDIPSIIIPEQVAAQFSARNDTSHPGRTFADLQREIERDMTRLVEDKNMAGFINLHHTPQLKSAAAEGRDEMAVYQPMDAKGQRPDYTTEWQFAVHGQKAMPVLDAISTDLKASYGIDLKAELEADGYSYSAIREMPLAQTINVLSTFGKARIDGHASGSPITPRVIIPVDTFSESLGVLGGSDSSLIRSAGALYGNDRTHIFQIDTGGGKATPGRTPTFQFGTDTQGNLFLERAAVDPNGPNGALAPTAYVRSAADMGEMFNRAYQNQLPLSREDAARIFGRP